MLMLPLFPQQPPQRFRGGAQLVQHGGRQGGRRALVDQPVALDVEVDAVRGEALPQRRRVHSHPRVVSGADDSRRAGGASGPAPGGDWGDWGVSAKRRAPL